MLVWGGHSGRSYLNDGGRDDPVANSWRAISTSSAPSARYAHTAVWTGTEMIVSGGETSPWYRLLNDTFSYVPARVLYLCQNP